MVHGLVRIPKERPKCRKVVRDLQAQGYSLRQIQVMDLGGSLGEAVRLQARRMELEAKMIRDKMNEEVEVWERLLGKKY